MQKKLNKIAKDTNFFLEKFIKKTKKIRINYPYAVWIVLRW